MRIIPNTLDELKTLTKAHDAYSAAIIKIFVFEN